MPTRKIGKAGNVTFGNHVMCVTKHDYDETNDLQEVSTTCSAGSDEFIAGYDNRKATIEWFMDFDAFELTWLYSGAYGVAILKWADSTFMVTGNSYVRNIKITNAAKGVVSGTGELQFSGAVTKTTT